MTTTHDARTARSGGHASRLGKYDLRVTARDAVDVVASAGGWLVDRAMAGWSVTVALPALCDPSSLRILGVTAPVAEDDDATAPLRSESLAASADALAVDEDLRRSLLHAAARHAAEVTLWGDASVAPDGFLPVRHVLSGAARAFKARALLAAGLDVPVGRAETFWTSTGALGDHSDLTPEVATSLAQR